MARPADDLEVHLIAAALAGILAAHRTKPDYKLVCRDAVQAGLRTALALRDEPKLEEFRAKVRDRRRR